MQTVCNMYWDAGKGNLTAQNTRKPFGGRGSAPDPLWGNLQHSRKHPSWWGGAGCPLPKNHTPTLGPSGLASSTPTPKLVPTPMLSVMLWLWVNVDASNWVKPEATRCAVFNERCLVLIASYCVVFALCVTRVQDVSGCSSCSRSSIRRRKRKRRRRWLMRAFRSYDLRHSVCQKLWLSIPVSSR